MVTVAYVGMLYFGMKSLVTFISVACSVFVRVWVGYHLTG